jgi:cell division septation protein DedD
MTMREMHKWKDKVELSLDNRQIFFLFFGLSVVGCFVFALGVMTGRRLQWDPAAQAKTLSPDSLALLDGDAQEQEPLLAFEEGLEESDAKDKPPTRDPSVPPASDEEVKARKEAEAAAKEQAKLLAAAPKPAPAAEPKLPAAQAKPAAPAADAQAQVEKEEALANAASAAALPAKAEPKGKTKTFTLQFKAFSRESDANNFADKLRRNGHDVRVESSVVRGRTWHRVRLGRFDTWEAGLAAKVEFEKAEHQIAYVVSE